MSREISWDELAVGQQVRIEGAYAADVKFTVEGVVANLVDNWADLGADGDFSIVDQNLRSITLLAEPEPPIGSIAAVPGGIDTIHRSKDGLWRMKGADWSMPWEKVTGWVVIRHGWDGEKK